MRKIYLARPWIGDEEIKAVEKVLRSGFLTEGKMTREFEERVAGYVGAKHGIATNSGTTAIESCLRALGIGEGDEVLVPDFTHPGTVNPVLLAGAEPVLVDVDLDSYNISVESLKKAIGERTKAIIAVSWGGNPLDPEVYELAEEKGVALIEDAACSLGAELNGKRVGSIADMTCFSFYPRKIITTGEGGMVTTDSDEYAKKIRAFKRFGISEGRFVQLGTNYVMSDVLAAIGVEQMKKLDKILEIRIEKAKIYDELLEGVEGVRLPRTEPNKKHVFQTYAIYIEKDGLRDKIMNKMRNIGVEVQIGTYALHLEPFFSKLKRSDGLKNSELLYRNLLALPLHHELSYEDQEFVCNTLKDLIREFGS